MICWLRCENLLIDVGRLRVLLRLIINLGEPQHRRRGLFDGERSLQVADRAWQVAASDKDFGAVAQRSCIARLLLERFAKAYYRFVIIFVERQRLTEQ